MHAEAQTDAAKSEPITLTISKQEKSISPDLIGIFYEDINYAADGGLYAELVRNRSFEFSHADNPRFEPLTAWSMKGVEEGKGSIKVESDEPLDTNNPHYLVVEKKDTTETLSLVNEGFQGMPLKAKEAYDFSVFARQIEGGLRPMRVKLVSSDGDVLAVAKLPNIGGNWKQYQTSLKATKAADNATLVIEFQGNGKTAVDMVSLFPRKTFMNHRNGLRADLAQTIADLKPKFMRFPGGCVAHGNGLDNMYRWKDTIGPVEQRKGQRNIWGYHQSYGLGYYEYFQFCEDMGAEPLPVVPAGVCCQNSRGDWGHGQRGIPMEEMDAYVQEILDLIEWANGPADSQWGAKRAAAGHPEPFNLKYIGVGNEDQITDVFRERFAMLNAAVKAKHPEITVIGTSGPFWAGYDYEQGWKIARELDIDMVDEHYYVAPDWFLTHNDFYDQYPRTGPTVYLGEYAAHDVGRRNTLRSALAEAAYLTALERNADIVRFSSYAPMLGKIGRTQWNPNMIYFDNQRILRTANYYVQQLFSLNGGDYYIQSEFDQSLQPEQLQGEGVLLGTWGTQSEYDDVRITSGDKVIAEETFEGEPKNWTVTSGDWRVEDGAYRQNERHQPALSVLNIEPPAGEYTISLRARKIGGREGFLIGFKRAENGMHYWWNLGGWGNSRHAIEKVTSGGGGDDYGRAVQGQIETNRWYDIRIEVQGENVRCYLDNELVHEIDAQAFTLPVPLYASAVRREQTGELMVKIVNVSDEAYPMKVDLSEWVTETKVADLTVLTGDAMATNTMEEPQIVVPKTKAIPVQPELSYEAPAHSLSVIRIIP